MLAIQKAKRADSCTANVLPCRIHHNGPTKVTKRYWQVTTEKDGCKTAYFRGRRLKGVAVPVPEGYEGEHEINEADAVQLNRPGLVVKSTEHKAVAPQPTFAAARDSDDEDEESEEPPKLLETISEIKEMIVWDHDRQPTSDDAFLKGVDEFIAFADAIHS
ncbi:uncharacterized protein AB675_4522 [Cyphellophora attinorum]|uniref:Uncharacterized protein n=1 Tax=Cyphellophora attinorum TaxID=1664694 RepID=A0A0N1HSB5_9EURO|nr:uncharacterized protein AB675_4522 [Phialophora attinorum]KPI39003.1 hypothetical protein AB675_4522 [Phialophora attinorum]